MTPKYPISESKLKTLTQIFYKWNRPLLILPSNQDLYNINRWRFSLTICSVLRGIFLVKVPTTKQTI